MLLIRDELNSRFSKIIFSETQINRLSQMLIANNRPLRRNVLEFYQLSASDLRKGVLCPQCHHVVMQ